MPKKLFLFFVNQTTEMVVTAANETEARKIACAHAREAMADNTKWELDILSPIATAADVLSHGLNPELVPWGADDIIANHVKE